MDRKMILEHLEMTHRHVADRVEQLERQRGVISNLEEKGLDSSGAIVLLQSFEEIQREHIAHRDRLEAQLAAS